MSGYNFNHFTGKTRGNAWMPLPEPYKQNDEGAEE